eukprot:GEMP01020313.1.p1 GENE.GEMP01020313.1~~GEMP01020313.1.p1  ORF type:complete len:502 (+),score=71.46 GEMP01020313.1:54-1508(+)
MAFYTALRTSFSRRGASMCPKFMAAAVWGDQHLWRRCNCNWDVNLPRVLGVGIGCATSIYLLSKVSEREPKHLRRAQVATVPLSMFLKLLQSRLVNEVAYSETPPYGAIHFCAPTIGACMALLVPGSHDHIWSEIAKTDCVVAAVKEASKLQNLGIGFFMDLAGLAASIGALIYVWKEQASSSPVQPETVSVSFADVAGMEETKMELREVIQYLDDPESFDALGARPPRGVLLTGPSGTGKTLFAKAVAGETNLPFLYQSASSFVEIYVGQGAARVRQFFDLARARAPCIVFIDELDALGHQRDSGGQGCSEYTQTLNQLLCELDGMRDASETPWCFIGATNRYHALDSALVRPGRLDRIIHVPLPDLEARHACLIIHLKNIRHDTEWDLWPLAQDLAGWNGAEIANMVNEAALVAARRKDPLVLLSHLEEVRERAHGKRETEPTTPVASSDEHMVQFDWRMFQPFMEALLRAQTRNENIIYSQ